MRRANGRGSRSPRRSLRSRRRARRARPAATTRPRSAPARSRLLVAAQVAADDGDVDEQQDDRDRHRGDDDGVPLGRPRVAERGRKHESDDGDADEPDLHEQRAAVDLALRPGPATCVTPYTSRRFEITLPESEPRTTTGRFAPTAKSATMSSGAFPKLALRKPPMPGPGVLRRVLGRLADQPRERDEGDRGEHEERDVAGVRELVDEDRDGREEERRPEELPAHRPSLKSRRAGMREPCTACRLPRFRRAVKSCAALVSARTMWS